MKRFIPNNMIIWWLFMCFQCYRFSCHVFSVIRYYYWIPCGTLIEIRSNIVHTQFKYWFCNWHVNPPWKSIHSEKHFSFGVVISCEYCCKKIRAKNWSNNCILFDCLMHESILNEMMLNARINILNRFAYCVYALVRFFTQLNSTETEINRIQWQNTICE